MGGEDQAVGVLEDAGLEDGAVHSTYGPAPVRGPGRSLMRELAKKDEFAARGMRRAGCAWSGDGRGRPWAYRPASWLLTARNLELIESGCPNVVCAQPFACLFATLTGIFTWQDVCRLRCIRRKPTSKLSSNIDMVRHWVLELHVTTACVTNPQRESALQEIMLVSASERNRTPRQG